MYLHNISLYLQEKIYFQFATEYFTIFPEFTDPQPMKFSIFYSIYLFGRINYFKKFIAKISNLNLDMLIKNFLKSQLRNFQFTSALPTLFHKDIPLRRLSLQEYQSAELLSRYDLPVLKVIILAYKIILNSKIGKKC